MRRCMLKMKIRVLLYSREREMKKRLQRRRVIKPADGSRSDDDLRSDAARNGDRILKRSSLRNWRGKWRFV
jgi:hypothetical protein